MRTIRFCRLSNICSECNSLTQSFETVANVDPLHWSDDRETNLKLNCGSVDQTTAYNSKIRAILTLILHTPRFNGKIPLKYGVVGEIHLGHRQSICRPGEYTVNHAIGWAILYKYVLKPFVGVYHGFCVVG